MKNKKNAKKEKNEVTKMQNFPTHTTEQKNTHNELKDNKKQTLRTDMVPLLS